jgi:Uma2 family endonuclease
MGIDESRVLERPLPARWRITADRYLRMAEAGVLPPELRSELIDGEIIEMAAMASPHFAGVARLDRFAHRAWGDVATIAAQLPVRLDDYNEPEPDLAVLRSRADFYAGALPGPSDILLIVEIADSSLAFDLGRKARMYAEAGVPEVWVLDVQAAVCHVHRGPKPDGKWAQVNLHRPGSGGLAPADERLAAVPPDVLFGVRG